MIARIYGGNLEGTHNVDDLWQHANGKTADLTASRNAGACVRRAELDNQPTLPGYCGPMWDGDGLRYETQEIYNQLSD